MKTIALALLVIISYLSILGCSIWAIVEFIIYLVKDHPFNWWSVWMFIVSIVSLFISLVLTTINTAKEEGKIYSRAKSKWQTKYDEMVNQQRNKNV